MFEKKDKYQINNKIASEGASNGTSKATKKLKPKAAIKLLHNILDGTILTRKRFVKSLPFAIYIVVLMIIYISGIFKTEKKLIEISNINKELKELRFEYITSKAKVMQLKHSSVVADKLLERGIKIPVDQPEKILIKNKINKKNTINNEQ